MHSTLILMYTIIHFIWMKLFFEMNTVKDTLNPPLHFCHLDGTPSDPLPSNTKHTYHTSNILNEIVPLEELLGIYEASP